MPGAVENRKLTRDSVIARQLHLDAIAHHGHDDGEMAVHRAFRPRRGARSIDDHREIAVVDLDFRLDLGLALEQVVEAFETGGRGGAGEIDRDEVDAARLQRRAPVGLRMEIIVDQRETDLSMAEDVVHVGWSEHRVDRHPYEARTMDAEQGFDELDGVVADGRDLLAGVQPACHEVVGEAVGVPLNLGIGDAPIAIGNRDALGKASRGALQQIADRDPADSPRSRHAAGCCKVSHTPSSLSTSFRGTRSVRPEFLEIPGSMPTHRPGMTTYCLTPKIRRASAGLATSRPVRRTQAASASISCPFDVTLVPSPR